MACILLWSSAVRVHDSQAYRKVDVTRQRISCILELKTYSCRSKLVSALSILLLPVVSWRVSQAWNPHQLRLSPGIWSLWLQNTKLSRDRHWEWSRLADDDLPPSPEKISKPKHTRLKSNLEKLKDAFRCLCWHYSDMLFIDTHSCYTKVCLR